MTRRARSLAVLAIILAGVIGIVSSTQTWLEATLSDGAQEVLAVPGADAVALLAPLSLAALALGLALSIVGTILRYVFGTLALAIGAVLTLLTWQVAFERPLTAVAGTVTDATGLAGTDAVTQLVASITVTAWPFAALLGWLVLIAGGVLTLSTARTWRSMGRRYRTDAAADTAGAPAASRPHDAIDSWDDLSRGDDPTA